MKTMKLYASMQNPEEISAVVKTAFKDKKADVAATENGLDITAKKLLSKETVRIRFLTQKLAAEAFAADIAAFKEKFSAASYEDEQTKKQLVFQLSFINLVLDIQSEKEIPEDMLTVFQSLTTKLAGMALLEDGSLLNNKNEPVYSPDGKRLAAEYRVYAAANMIRLPKGSESPESKDRKNRSIEQLKALDIPVLAELPTIGDSKNTKLRSKDDICERAASLVLLIQYAFDVAQNGDLKKSKELVEKALIKYEVLDCLTPAEQQFLYTDTPSVQQANSITWHYEAVWVLLWSLGYVETLALPNKTCNARAAFEALTKNACYDDFYDNAAVRPIEEILDTADFTYRLDWACVDARLKKQTLPQNIDFGITMERHRAFNWLLRYGKSEWDAVSSDT